MSLRTNILAIVIAAGMALAPVTGALTATTAVAAPGGFPQVDNASQSKAAADYLVSQLVDNNHLNSTVSGLADTGLTADGLIGIADSQSNATAANAINEWLQTQAASESSSGTMAKIAIAASAMGEDPKNYGGVDLIRRLMDQTANNGGNFGDPFAQALVILAMSRAGEEVPDEIVAELLTMQYADGKDKGGFYFTSDDDEFVDIDTTGVAVQALMYVGDHPGTTEAKDNALAYIKQTKTGDYWPTYSPANTAGTAGVAQREAGVDVSGTEAWLIDQQQAGGGLPAELGGTEPDVLATAGGILMLTGGSYHTAAFVPEGASEATSTQQPNQDDQASQLWLLLPIGAAAFLISAFVWRRRSRR